MSRTALEEDWEKWSNDLAELLPEGYESMFSNPEGAQESIIEDVLRTLVKMREDLVAYCAAQDKISAGETSCTRSIRSIIHDVGET